MDLATDVLRAAVKGALDDFFRETAAPLISLLLERVDASAPTYVYPIDEWLREWPHTMPAIPPAGTWIRSGGPWHLSSGEGDQPLHGRTHG